MKKINWILILQAWAILWVVIGHSPLKMPISSGDPLYVDILYKIAYSFHMPLFIFVSGYLFYLTRIKKEMQYGKMVVDKLQRLGIPFVVFTLISMVLKTIFSASMARPSEISINEFVHAILFPGDGPLGELWFIAVIMWCFIFSPLWKMLLSQQYITLPTIIFLYILHLFVPNFANSLLCMDLFFQKAIYFFLGMCCCKWINMEKFHSTQVTYILSVLSVITYVLCFIFFANLTEIVTFLGIVSSICIALSLDKLFPKVFCSFRDYTYQIYLMGIFIQIGCKTVFNKTTAPYTLGFIVCTILGLYIPVLVSKVLERINRQPLMLCVGLKKK